MIEGHQAKLYLKNVNEAVSLDIFAEIALNTSVRLSDDKKQNLKDIFQAANLKNNGGLEFDEVKILSKLLVNPNVDIKKLFELYCNHQA